jgi:hypothetical protein
MGIKTVNQQGVAARKSSHEGHNYLSRKGREREKFLNWK